MKNLVIVLAFSVLISSLLGVWMLYQSEPIILTDKLEFNISPTELPFIDTSLPPHAFLILQIHSDLFTEAKILKCEHLFGERPNEEYKCLIDWTETSNSAHLRKWQKRLYPNAERHNAVIFSEGKAVPGAVVDSLRDEIDSVREIELWEKSGATGVPIEVQVRQIRTRAGWNKMGISPAKWKETHP